MVFVFDKTQKERSISSVRITAAALSILTVSAGLAQAQDYQNQTYYGSPYHGQNYQMTAQQMQEKQQAAYHDYAMQKHMKPAHDAYGNPISRYYGGVGHEEKYKPDNSTYIALQVGYTRPTKDIEDFDSAANFAFAVGKQIHPLVRIETEISHRENSIKGWIDDDTTGKLDVSNTALMLNLLYDFDNKSAFVPYIGVGAGVSFGRLEGTVKDSTGTYSGKDDSPAIAYQAIAGVAYNITEQIALTADYRYHGTGDYKVKVVDEDDFSRNTKIGSFSAHEFRAGVRYKF